MPNRKGYGNGTLDHYSQQGRFLNSINTAGLAFLKSNGLVDDIMYANGLDYPPSKPVGTSNLTCKGIEKQGVPKPVLPVS